MNPQVPNALSISRIVGAFALVLTGGLNEWFLAIFTLCAVTDFLDGYIARRYGLCSDEGEIIDSVADFAVVMAMLLVLIPTLPWDQWMIQLIALIAAIRGISLCVGAIRFGRVALLHTFLNKTAGFLLRLSPFFIPFCDLGAVVAVVCTVSLVGALEDLAINLRADSLDRNIRSCLDLKPRNRMKYRGTDGQP